MTCVGSLIALECASHAIKRAKVLKKKIAEFSDKPDHLKIAASKVPCLSLSLSLSRAPRCCRWGKCLGRLRWGPGYANTAPASVEGEVSGDPLGSL